MDLSFIESYKRAWLRAAFVLGLVFFATSLQAASVLNFPRLSNETGRITGATFVNPTNTQAQITVTAYSGDGSLIQGADITNPAQLTVPANQQVGLLTVELFGKGLSPSTVGWFQATSPVDGITGFFLFLEYPSGPTILDGADIPPVDYRIVFNHIRVGQGYSTELNIFNTGDVSSVLDLFLIDNTTVTQRTLDGQNVLAAKGVVRLDVQTLFGVNQVSEGASVLVISNPTLIGGFEFVRPPGGDLLGLNARSAGETLNTIYFPQLAVLGPWKMEIGVVNYSPKPTSVVITAHKPDGSLYGPQNLQQNPVMRNLVDQGILVEDVQTLFGFSGSAPLDGWVKVTSNQASINGFVSYGVPSQGSIAAVAAPAQARKQAIFSHIATTQGFFTGVAALNASAFAADVRIAALRANNQILGVFDTVLQPGQRISKTLQELIFQAGGQAGGIIWVQSSQPIYLTSLFGTVTGSVLSNVPPQPAPSGYNPAAGRVRLDVAPDFAVLGLQDSQQFTTSTIPPGQPFGGSWAVEGVNGGDGTVGTVSPAGFYRAPGQLPPVSPLTVTAGNQQVVAGATVDLLDRLTFEANLPEATDLVVFPVSRRLFVILQEGTTSTVVEITQNEILDIFSYPAEEIGSATASVSSDGREFLLLAGQSRLIRLEPDQLNPSSRDVLTGLSVPFLVLAMDPVTGHLLAVENGGITQVSAARIEADLISSSTEIGKSHHRILARSGITGLSVDGCSGTIYFSRGGLGLVSSFSRDTGGLQTVASGLANPGPLLLLNRKDTVCGSASHLLVSEQGAGRISLLNLADNSSSHWYTLEDPGEMAFLPADQPLYSNEAVLVLEGKNSGLEIALVDVLNLYQGYPPNPVVQPVGARVDPAFDEYGSFQHDIVELWALYDGSALVVEVYFAEPISPCEDPCDDPNLYPATALAGFIDIDLDRNASTGLVSLIDLNSPHTSGLGVDLFVSLGSYLASSSDVGVFDANEDLVGVAPTQFSDRSVRVEIPSSLLTDGTDVALGLVAGAVDEASDVAPNGGHLLTGPWTGSGPLADSAARVRPAASGLDPRNSGRARGWQDRKSVAPREKEE